MSDKKELRTLTKLLNSNFPEDKMLHIEIVPSSKTEEGGETKMNNIRSKDMSRKKVIV